MIPDKYSRSTECWILKTYIAFCTSVKIFEKIRGFDFFVYLQVGEGSEPFLDNPLQNLLMALGQISGTVGFCKSAPFVVLI